MANHLQHNLDMFKILLTTAPLVLHQEALRQLLGNNSPMVVRRHRASQAMANNGSSHSVIHTAVPDILSLLLIRVTNLCMGPMMHRQLPRLCLAELPKLPPLVDAIF